MSKKLILIWEITEAELLHFYKAEKEEKVKERLLMLMLAQEGKNGRKSAKIPKHALSTLAC